MSQATYGTTLYADTRIDREAGIIRGVSVFQEGEIADRGLFADAKTISLIKGFCEGYANGVKVKANHKSGIFDVSGVLRSFRTDGGTLRADLHVLKSEENTDKLMEMAEQIPDTFGLSVSIEQEIEKVGGKMCIRPTSVFSVDLVTEPAACPTGLFSTRRIDAKPNNKMNPEELLKQFTAINDKLTAFEARIATFEKQKTDESAKERDEFGKKFGTLETAVTSLRDEFSKNQADLVGKVAAEFSKVIGTVQVKASATDTTKQSEEQKAKPEDAFAARVEAEFAKNGGSKTKAMSAAIAADVAENKGAGYTAFISTGKAVNYAKK